MWGKSGIYRITNAVNGKFYIGSAVNLSKRFSKHRYELKNGKHKSRTLSAAWIKHGESAFRFEVLLICSTQDLLFYEQRVMDALKPQYNLRLIAASNFGLKQTAEIIAKRIAHQFGNQHTLGYRHTDETKARMSLARTGVPHSPEWKENIARAKRGKALTPEHCLNISIGKRNPSTETLDKMRMAKLGTKHSAETRRKMSLAHTMRARIKRGLTVPASAAPPLSAPVDASAPAAHPTWTASLPLTNAPSPGSVSSAH